MANDSPPETSTTTHHVAVLLPHYLRLILEGRKPVDCRLMKFPRPPFDTVAGGHRVWLKESCGPVLGYATVDRVRQWEHLTPASLQQLRRNYNHLIMADTKFWINHADARYAVLIWLKNVAPCRPFTIHKTDPRPWVTLSGPPADCQPFNGR